MPSRSADLTREWEPLTPAHEQALSNFHGSYDELLAGESPDPLAIVGAYRSGKTQLMYQMFREAWDRNIGAIYVSDPGDLLSEFEDAAEEDIAVWLSDRIEQEVSAYITQDPDNVTWFPNASSEQKDEWLDTWVTVDSAADIDKYAIFIDEVEQHYENFLEAIETDDSNPLRIINDEVPDTLKVWSFGMLSAYEFIGEADWGRLHEIRVPPLDVGEVQTRLEEERPYLTSLANILWWMGRGRTGLIIKFIDELPADATADIADWVQSMADVEAQSTRVVDPIWTDLDSEEWVPACRALAFQSDGLDSWLLTDDEAYTAEDMVNLVSNIIFEATEFPDDDESQTAKRIIRRNTERVFDGLCLPDQRLFPHREVIFDRTEIKGLLSLIEDQILSFEPTGPSRRRAAEALDIDPSEFSSGFYDANPETEEVAAEVTVPKPSKLDSAFQPIALNPDLVCSTPTRELRDEMNEALAVNTGHHLNISIYFCPTETALERELQSLRTDRDITEPRVFVVPTNMEEAVPAEYDIFERHSLINITTHESSLLWDFIVNLWGTLEERNMTPTGGVDDSVRRELLEQVESRDVRNTIETLYDQVERFSHEQVGAFLGDYVGRYSRPETTTLLWNEDRLQGEAPFWATGEISELQVTLSYLLVFSDPPDFGQRYGNIHNAIETAIDEDLISGGTSFPYSEYLDNLYGANGFTPRLNEEREHYSEGGHLHESVEHTQTALYDLAADFDEEEVIDQLNNLDNEARKGEIPLLDVDIARHAYAFLRANLMCKIATSESSQLDLASRLADLADDLRSTKADVEGALERIETANETLTEPECASVGTWIELDPGIYDTYRDKLETVIAGVENLATQIEINPGIKPLAYAYWIQLRQFNTQMSKKFDERETTLAEMDVTTVEDLKQIYDDLYQTAENSDVLVEYFTSREQIRTRIEASGEDVFDYATGEHRLALPDNIDRVNEINEIAGERREDLERIRTLLDKLEDRHEAVQEDVEHIEGGLEDLLTTALDTPEGEA